MTVIPNFVVTPLPSPASPWQGEQLMLNRSRPRAISWAVTGTGINGAQLVVPGAAGPGSLPVLAGVSSHAEPRAIVPSTGNCELRPSLNVSLNVCGRSFGW